MARLPVISVCIPGPGPPRGCREPVAVLGTQFRDAGVAANKRPPPPARPAAVSTATCGPPSSSSPETMTGPRMVAAVKLTADNAYPVMRSAGSATRSAHRARMLLGVAGKAAPPVAASAAKSAGGPSRLVASTRPTREQRHTELAVTSTAVCPRRSIRAPWTTRRAGGPGAGRPASASRSAARRRRRRRPAAAAHPEHGQPANTSRARLTSEEISPHPPGGQHPPEHSVVHPHATHQAATAASWQEFTGSLK